MGSTITVVNFLYLLLFVVGLTIAFIRILVRFISFLRHKRKAPRLLLRDLVLMGGLAFPFLAILTVRAFGLGPLLQGQLWWVLVTGTPAILALYYFIYYEFFVIETDL